MDNTFLSYQLPDLFQLNSSKNIIFIIRYYIYFRNINCTKITIRIILFFTSFSMTPMNHGTLLLSYDWYTKFEFGFDKYVFELKAKTHVHSYRYSIILKRIEEL